jgi:hypothetical protein
MLKTSFRHTFVTTKKLKLKNILHAPFCPSLRLSTNFQLISLFGTFAHYLRLSNIDFWIPRPKKWPGTFFYAITSFRTGFTGKKRNS